MGDDTCFIVGYTGATGQALIKVLINDPYFKRIVLIGRRKADLPSGTDERFTQEVVNFDELENHKQAFKDCSIGFCCLGTTRKIAGKAGFVKVDRDYVLSVAGIAKESGCKYFHLLSSQGADKNSSILFSKTKGEVEEGVTNLGLQKLSIYRPGMLLAERTEPRLFEKLFYCCCCSCHKCCPNRLMMSVDDLAQAFVIRSKQPPPADWELLDNSAIYHIVHDEKL